MRRIALFAILSLVIFVAPRPGSAQVQDQTLADIRQELSVLFVEMRRLTRELSTTGGAAATIGGDTLQRIDLIEAELKRLTSKTEELEFRINRVVTDGTNRIGDLDFRLCELETGCDISTLGTTSMLGGVTGVEAPPTQPAVQPVSTELAIGEQSDFDRAVSALDSGEYAAAAEQFQTFTDTYTGGPLTSEAHFLRGEALAGLGNTSGAARAFLESFSGQPDGARAADALLRLGETLAELGQTSEACVTLGEVATRFPGAEQISRAEAKRQSLGCS